eukprot:gene1185-biopygen9522
MLDSRGGGSKPGDVSLALGDTGLFDPDLRVPRRPEPPLSSPVSPSAKETSPGFDPPPRESSMKDPKSKQYPRSSEKVFGRQRGDSVKGDGNTKSEGGDTVNEINPDKLLINPKSPVEPQG